MNRLLWLGVLALFFGRLEAQVPLTDIGYLPGGNPNSVSGYGFSIETEVIVGHALNSSSQWEAFRWTSGGGMVGLGDLAGGTFNSTAYAVSSDGSVVVGSGTSASGTEAFRWTSGGGMVGLGDLAGGTFGSRAYAVNADGTVVVGYGTSASGTEAFRWTSGGGMVGLGDLAGGGFGSMASGVTPDGSVVVGYGTSASGTEAFRWTSGGGMTGLGTLAGGTFSRAYAISEDGNVIIGASEVTGGVERAFRWTSGGGMQDLGTGFFNINGGNYMPNHYFAQSTTSDGSIIVGLAADDTGFGLIHRFFIWDSVNGMRDLFDFLNSDFGIDASGGEWYLSSAWYPEVHISADGQRISGYSAAGRTFFFAIPEPSSVALLVAGCAAAGWAIRRRVFRANA